MKYLIAILALTIVMSANRIASAQSVVPDPTNDAQAFVKLYADAKYPAILKFGDHILKVSGSKDIFIPEDDPSDINPLHKNKDIFIGIFSVTYDEDDLINDVYCKINDRTEEIHYQSSDPKVVTVSNHEGTNGGYAGRIVVHGVGNAIVTLVLAGQPLKLPLKVTKLPVYIGMSTDDLIKLLGLPDKKTFDVVEWPDHKYVDGISYEPSATQEKLYAEHWFYNKYPKVAFAVDNFPFVVQVQDLGW